VKKNIKIVLALVAVVVVILVVVLVKGHNKTEIKVAAPVVATEPVK